MLHLAAAVIGEIGQRDDAAHAARDDVDLVLAGLGEGLIDLLCQQMRVAVGIQPPVVGEEVDVLRPVMAHDGFEQPQLAHGGLAGQVGIVGGGPFKDPHGYVRVGGISVFVAAHMREQPVGVVQQHVHHLVLAAGDKGGGQLGESLQQLARAEVDAGLFFFLRAAVAHHAVELHAAHDDQRVFADRLLRRFHGVDIRRLADGKGGRRAGEQHRRAQQQGEDAFFHGRASVC